MLASDFDNKPKMSRFRRFLKHLFTTEDWRLSAFYILFAATLVMETVPVSDALGDIASKSGSNLAAWFLVLCYILVLVGLFWRSLSLRTRTWLGIASLYLYGTTLLAHTGTFSGGRTYLLVASLLASVLISMKSGIILLTATLVIPLVLGQAYLSGLVNWDVSTILWKKWLISTVGHSLLGAALTISVTIIIRRLESSLIEARNSRDVINHRLQMEKLTASISVRVGSARIEQFEDAIQWALQSLGELMRVDRAYLFGTDAAHTVWNNTHEWCAQGIASQIDALQNLPMAKFGWWQQQMENNVPIILNDIGTISESEPVVYALLREQGIASTLAVPLIREDSFYGFIGFDTLRNKREWNIDDVQLLRTIADILAGRKRRAGYEQELVESERRYRMLVENAPIGVVLVDEKGYVLETNSSAEKLGDIPQFHPGESLLETDVLIKSNFVEQFKQCLSEDVHCTGDILYRQDLHMERWARYHLARMNLGENQPGQVLVVVEDTSHAHALQETLNRSQRMEALGRLAGGVAHDFNNLLTVINGYMEMTLETPNLDPALKDDLVIVAEAGSTASKLTSQLLLFSRRQEAKVERVEVNQLLHDMNSLLGRLINESIELDLELTDEPCYIQADSSQIEQVVMNLVVNARDAILEGGRIQVGVRHITIDKETAEIIPDAVDGEHVQIFVQDTGTGMTPEVLQHIFEPFFTTKAENRGTGLGLATVYGIVTKFDGHITVDSEPGKGSIFYINIPFNNDETWQNDEAAEVISDHSYSSEQYTILLVEDDATVRRLVKRSLENMNYTVNDAPNADAALEMLQSGLAVDLVISDVVMPGMSGIKLARALHELSPAIPIILMSGYPQELSEAEDIRDEGVPLLLKPVKRQELLEVIQQVLQQPPFES